MTKVMGFRLSFSVKSRVFEQLPTNTAILMSFCVLSRGKAHKSSCTYTLYNKHIKRVLILELELDVFQLVLKEKAPASDS